MIRKVVSSIVVISGLAAVACSSENVGDSSESVDYICGKAAAATLDGIPAYPYCANTNVWSNNGYDTKSASGGAGWVQTEGGFGYQCVEYAVRYEHFKFGIATGWGNAYAYQMCNNHPAGISKVSSPVHGDLMIFAPGSCGSSNVAGHVAVVNTVGATTVNVVQENVAGSFTYNKSCASCWLHASANSGSSDPCSKAQYGGYYCGQSTQFGGGTKDVLYDCQNGATVSKQTCTYGCLVEPAGTNDKCAPPPADAGSDASKDAATDASSSSDASKDATPTSDAASNDAASQEDAGGPVEDVGGCSVARADAPTSHNGAAGLALLLGASLMLRRRRR